MDSRQEHVGGLGSLLALWGPLIIVAFLVLVFRGGEERDSTVAVGPDTASEAAARTPDAMAHRPLVGATIDPARGAVPDESMSAPSGVPHGPAEAFDGGFTMRTSMATPVFAGGGTATGMPPVVRRAGSIRHHRDPIAIRDTAASPPERAGPPATPVTGCGPPKVADTRVETTAAMLRCNGCGARHRTTGVPPRAARPGRDAAVRRPLRRFAEERRSARKFHRSASAAVKRRNFRVRTRGRASRPPPRRSPG